MQEKQFKNGDYYSGEWKDNKPHGDGTLINHNGMDLDSALLWQVLLILESS